MRQFVRQNGLLLIGFALSLIVLLAPPIGRLLDLINDFERQSQLRAMPALVVLVGAYLFNQTRKRHHTHSQAAVEAAAADVAKREGGRRALDIQRLVTFANEAATAENLDAIKRAINLHLGRIIGSEKTFVMMREGPRWEVLTGSSDPAAEAERVEFAEGIIAGNRPGVTRDHRAGFPLMLGDTVYGVLGINHAGKIEEDRQRTIEAAASMLAVSLRNVHVLREVREAGIRDGLTGCWNRTHAMEVLDSELRRARRSKLPVAIIMFDLDHFKQINDRYGHLCGDTVLMHIGQRMRDVLRSSDLKSRYGGEEFLAVLPSTTLHGAGCVAETLRREIESKPVTWGNEVLTVTASIGVTQAEPGELDMDAIISRADAALYRAKQQGRNCVRLEPDNPPPLTVEGRRADIDVLTEDESDVSR